MVGQRLMQSASDIFLGWVSVVGFDGRERDFYVRQLWDWKGSIDLDTILPYSLRVYGELCGWTLARAHARSGDAVAIAPTSEPGTSSTGPSFASPKDTPTKTIGTMPFWLASLRQGRVAAQSGV